MRETLLATTIFFLFHLASPAHAAPNPEAANPVPTPPLLRVTLHKLENGEKKSSKSITAQAGGSAETFTVNNGKFERSFFNPELRDDGKVTVHLHECEGAATPELMANPSSLECRAEIMSRMNFEASVNQPTIVEATGAGGEKEEYFLFVEKVSGDGQATTL